MASSHIWLHFPGACLDQWPAYASDPIVHMSQLLQLTLVYMCHDEFPALQALPPAISSHVSLPLSSSSIWPSFTRALTSVQFFHLTLVHMLQCPVFPSDPHSHVFQSVQHPGVHLVLLFFCIMDLTNKKPSRLLTIPDKSSMKGKIKMSENRGEQRNMISRTWTWLNRWKHDITNVIRT